jgi:hypothetical protein
MSKPSETDKRDILRVTDPASGRSSTFRLKSADARNLAALMDACGMRTETNPPDREPPKHEQRRRSR